MWCTVYPLYVRGKRLSATAAKARGHYGWLHMHSKQPGTGMPQSRAFLLPAEDAPLYSPILELDACDLRAITKGCIRLTGIDPLPPSGRMTHHQSWWIIPGERP